MVLAEESPKSEHMPSSRCSTTVVKEMGSGDRLRLQSHTGCGIWGRLVTLSEHQMPHLCLEDSLLAFIWGRDGDWVR
jgi:hypothetical protein